VKRFLRMSYLAASVAGVGFFAMSVLLLAVWPGRVLERQIRSTAPDHPLALTASEERGRVIYGQNGCAYCHTQQIRYLDRDVKRFGAATLAWETIFDYPQLWGTRRIGPDLSREYGIHSYDWEFAHLYEPRSIVADSVMPPFPWLFDGAPDRPKQTARDVVAYLETLGRNRALAGREGEEHSRANCQCSDDERRAAYGARLLDASASIPRRLGDFPKLSPNGDSRRGLRLYASNCASCHGRRGEGNGPGAAGLRPRPTNFTEHEYTLDSLSFTIWNGVAGTSMPAWRDLTVQELSDIATAVRGLHQREVGAVASDAGREIYEAQCAQCHGQNGGGDGPASARFAVGATNFRAVRPAFEASIRALRDGVEGTAMPSWSHRLSSSEMRAVAGYVRGFFQPDTGARR
jgi:cbb3-type cytochrome oxidase cytochrome c subunit